jgi:hypothetical protein
MTEFEPCVTVQVCRDWHISVTPFEFDKVIEPLVQLYDPDANVMVAPSLALLIADWTSPIVLPAVQLQV